MHSAYCKGEAKATNVLRELLGSLRKGSVPARWRALYSSRSTLTLGEWVADLAARAKVLTTRYTAALAANNSSSSSTTGSSELMKCIFWVGGMFTPEAFITATRQQTAQVPVSKEFLQDFSFYPVLSREHYRYYFITKLFMFF